jgi:hypothetical protein
MSAQSHRCRSRQHPRKHDTSAIRRTSRRTEAPAAGQRPAPAMAGGRLGAPFGASHQRPVSARTRRSARPASAPFGINAGALGAVLCQTTRTTLSRHTPQNPGPKLRTAKRTTPSRTTPQNPRAELCKTKRTTASRTTQQNPHAKTPQDQTDHSEPHHPAEPTRQNSARPNRSQRAATPRRPPDRDSARPNGPQ